MSDEDISLSKSLAQLGAFLKSLQQRPVQTLLGLTLLVLSVILVVGNFQIETDFPYITGLQEKPLPSTTNAILGLSLAVMIVMWLIISRRKSEPSRPNDPDPDRIDAVIKEKILNPQIYDLGESGLQLTSIRAYAAIDRLGSYYGIYEREGVVKASGGSVQVTVHVCASGAPLDSDQLAVIAFDLDEKTSLQITFLTEDAWCKVFKISFVRPKREGSVFRVRWMFVWPRCMNELRDGDTIPIRIFSNPPHTAELTLQLPAKPDVFHAFAETGIEKAPRDVEEFDPPRRHIYTVRENAARTIDALSVFYKIVKEKDRVQPLSDMIEIVAAIQNDIEQVHLLEQEIEPISPASEAALLARWGAFSEGFLVAKVGPYVVGYIESCRWDREEYTTFQELSDVPGQHRNDGQYLYVIFLGVAPPFRRKGIAHKLIDRMIALAQDEQVHEIHVVSVARLVSFYERHGFSRVSDLPDFVRGGAPGILMKRAVPRK